MDYPRPYELKPVLRNDFYLDPRAAEVVRNPQVVPLIDGTATMAFGKSSEVHGRTMEDPNGYIFTGEPVTDEFDDTYTVFTVKGGDASLPLALLSPHEPHNVRVQGMLDAEVFRHCRQASRLLREAGVLTEWPILQARPAIFPDGEGDVNLYKFKAMIYDNYVDWEKDTQAKVGSRGIGNGIGRAGAIGDGLADMRFGVMYRAMLTNVRVAELERIADKEVVAQKVGAAIAALQRRRPEHFAAAEALSGLDPASPADQQTYLTTILPDLMGENHARVMEFGLHRYPNSLNWTLAGELVDLDSFVSPHMYPEAANQVTVASRLTEIEAMGGPMKMIAKYTGANLVDLYQRYYQSYFAYRYLDENLPDIEGDILDAAMLISKEADIEAPYFIDLQNELLMKLYTQIDAAYRGKNPDEADSESQSRYFQHVADNLLPAVLPLVEAGLQSAGIDPVNISIITQVIARNETAKYIFIMQSAKVNGNYVEFAYSPNRRQRAAD